MNLAPFFPASRARCADACSATARRRPGRRPRRTPPPAAKDAPAPAAGTWSHAFTAYGEPKYPRDFKSLRLGQSRRAEGRDAVPQQPRPAHELRQVQPVHGEGQRADGRDHPHVRVARRPLGRRARHDVRPRGGGNAGRRRTGPRSRSASIRRRGSTTATRSRPPTSSTRSTCWRARARRPPSVPSSTGSRPRRSSTSAPSVSTSRIAPPDTIFTSARCRSSRASGARAPTASRSRSTR